MNAAPRASRTSVQQALKDVQTGGAVEEDQKKRRAQSCPIGYWEQCATVRTFIYLIDARFCARRGLSNSDLVRSIVPQLPLARGYPKYSLSGYLKAHGLSTWLRDVCPSNFLRAVNAQRLQCFFRLHTRWHRPPECALETWQFWRWGDWCSLRD